MFKFGKDYKLDLGGGGTSLGAGARGGSALEVSKNILFAVCLFLPCRSRRELLAIPDASLPAMMVMVSNPLKL